MKCTPVNAYEMNEWSSWICTMCVTVFPYYNINDDDLVKIMKSQDGILPTPDHMLFNPFDVSPYSNTKFTEFLDPD